MKAMPNIWAHLIFGQEAVQAIGRPDLIDGQLQRKLFHLGCQGPDFLFYHHFLPWQKDKRLNRLGSRMHKERCGDALVRMLAFAQVRPQERETKVYALGFLLHHVLDRNLHPYVFTRSGFRKWDHQRFEMAMDTIVAGRLRGIDTWKTPVWKQFDIGSRFPASVTDMLEEVASALYSGEAPLPTREEWNAAYRDMRQAQKLFHDPSGIKRLLTLRQIEPLVYLKRNPPLDFMNESHREWHDPTNREERYTSSAWDLWDQAMEDARRVLPEAIAYAEGPNPEPPASLLEALGNRSYEHGRDCDSGLEIRYADPIYD